jgi:hypothetical protein
MKAERYSNAANAQNISLLYSMALNGIIALAENLRNFNTEAVVEGIVSDNAERITELQREQLAEGVGRDGKPRIDEYRPLTVYLKRTNGVGLGAVTDRVTFFMTGGLYGSLRTKVLGPVYETTSPLATYDKMVERIGDENFGLAPEQRLEFATTVTLPKFGEALYEKTGLKI